MGPQASKQQASKLDSGPVIWYIWEIMRKKKTKKIYKPTATLKDYQEAIQILMVDYADVWEKTGTFKEVDKKLKKLGI